MKKKALDATLKQRGSIYGDFTDNAQIAQGIKQVMRSHSGWDNMEPVHREALDVIASKISRIITGDPNYKDNWHDIQGYAKITEDRCK